jgi:hypothetical protein
MIVSSNLSIKALPQNHQLFLHLLGLKPIHKEKIMLKHIGRHGDRKVAIVFREVPGNEHMCLVIYPDVLPTHIHDTIMKVIESPVGQAENSLANALHRNLLPDGRPILEALHREGMLKKVAAEQVIVTPTPTSSVKLDELNRLIKELETGGEAAKRMAEIDANSGIVAPEKKRAAEAEFKRKRIEQEQLQRQRGQPLQAAGNSALDDKSLAANMLSQAKLMETEAKGLVAEAARLKKEAEKMFPSVNTKDAVATPPAATAEKGRGRPKKAVATDAVQ